MGAFESQELRSKATKGKGKKRERGLPFLRKEKIYRELKLETYLAIMSGRKRLFWERLIFTSL